MRATRPAYGDAAIKAVLDNSRLDYVYEPDWNRLVGRACQLVASSKTVAWFQDGNAEGENAEGENADVQSFVLADPAARFVRDNVNGFLFGRPLEAPLPTRRVRETEGPLADFHAAWHARTGRDELVVAEFLRDRSMPVTTPRMAVQAFFSSAIDAIVIGRFLLMKDYWLMRSGL